MKGYIVDGKAYIFPQTAAEIPEVEADAFYVQEENFTEWVAENESIADKLVKYNYNLMSVQPKVWAGHEDDDLTPQPQNSTITVVIQDTQDGQPYGDPQVASDSYEVGTSQVIDLGVMMIDGTYSNPICSDETFVDWSFNAGNDEDDPETPESEAYNATITITSVPNEDLTFTFEHSVD